VFLPAEDAKGALEQLGKFKTGKGCIYVKKLYDINVAAVEKYAKQPSNTLKRTIVKSVKNISYA
jgi:hypothetical protein